MFSTQDLLMVYAICTLVMWFKFKFAVAHSANRDNHPPEYDNKVLGAPLPEPPPPQEYKNRLRAYLDDVENILLDMTVFWAGFIAVSQHGAASAQVRLLRAHNLVADFGR